MSHADPIFACRGPVFTPAETALILGLFVAWMVSLVLVVVNLVFIFLARARRSFVVRQSAVFGAYLGLAALLFALAFNNVAGSQPVVWVLPFLVPVLVIGHFVYLISDRRRGKRAERGFL